MKIKLNIQAITSDISTTYKNYMTPTQCRKGNVLLAEKIVPEKAMQTDYNPFNK